MFRLLDWAYYYNVLSRFSLRHWRPQRPDPVTSGVPVCRTGRTYKSVLCESVQARNMSLVLLDRAASAVLPPSDPKSQMLEYRENLDELEREIQAGCHLGMANSERPSPGVLRNATIMDELHRLCALIYLARVSNKYPRGSAKLGSYVSRGFALLGSLPHCWRLLPLMVLGFEARDDDERSLVLQLIGISEETCNFKGRLRYIRGILHAVWTQEDLHAEEGTQVAYSEMLTTIMSATGVMLPFA